MPESPDPGHLDRLRQLEEAAAFADRHAEQLSQQIVEVWQRIDALTSRLGSMESRLSEMHQSITDQQANAQPSDDPAQEPGPGGPGHDPESDNNQQIRAHRPPHWDGKH